VTTPASSTKRAPFADVLRNRDFLALWLGQVISQIGDSFTNLALLITVNRLTGSVAAMGLMLISLSVPQLVFSFLAGVVVDRVDRKRVMILSDLLRGLLVLAFVTVHTAEQVYLFYVVGFLLSSVSVFFTPAKTAMIPRIIKGDDKLLSANALSQTVRVVALLLGPVLAGLAIAWLGTTMAFVVDSVSYFVSAIAILTISTSGQIVDQAKSSLRLIWDRLAEGISYTRHNKTILGIIVTLLVAFLGVGAVEVLFVPYLQGEFGAGPEALGFVQTAQGLGMLVGSVLVGSLAARFRLTRIIAWHVAVLGAAVAFCSLVSELALIVLAMFVVGLTLAPVNAALSTLVQTTVPDAKMGRVSSVVDTTTVLSYLLSMGGAAFLADAFGVRNVLFAAGLVTALSFLPALTMMKEPETITPTPAESGAQPAQERLAGA
jgi:DHA3 family macrolide efflux protein-like MFS transporter